MPVGTVEAAVPDVDATCDAELRVVARDDRGEERARDRIRLAVLPAASATTERPLRLHVVDPGLVWGVEAAVQRLGHAFAGAADADLIVATELSADLLRRVEEDGRRALVLVRSRDAIGASDLARRVGVVLRKLPWAGAPGQRSPWEGDWVSSFSWLLPGAFPGLPDRRPLDFAYEEVLPDHVLTGYDPGRHRDEVSAGMFVGWVHSPAALLWTFRQGRGVITLTTLHVAPESGPIATALLERLLQTATSADRRGPDREPAPENGLASVTARRLPTR
jgi:hypothetical protein